MCCQKTEDDLQLTLYFYWAAVLGCLWCIRVLNQQAACIVKAATASALFSPVKCLAQRVLNTVRRTGTKANCCIYVGDNRMGNILDSAFKTLPASISFFVKMDQVKPYELTMTGS